MDANPEETAAEWSEVDEGRASSDTEDDVREEGVDDWPGEGEEEQEEAQEGGRDVDELVSILAKEGGPALLHRLQVRGRPRGVAEGRWRYTMIWAVHHVVRQYKDASPVPLLGRVKGSDATWWFRTLPPPSPNQPCWFRSAP